MFGRWLKPSVPVSAPSGAEELERLVRGALGGSDSESVMVVVALAGLLGAAAYADRDYSENEEAHVRRELLRVHGMTAEAVDAVCAETDASPAQVSLAWLLHKPGVTSVIFGARTEEQLAENLAAASLALTPAQVARLDEASAVDPGYPYTFIKRIQGRW